MDGSYCQSCAIPDPEPQYESPGDDLDDPYDRPDPLDEPPDEDDLYYSPGDETTSDSGPDPSDNDDNSDDAGGVQVLEGEDSDDHHIFPQAFREWFEDPARGINIDNYCVPALDAFHSLLHSAGWNQEWEHFIKVENPNATRYEIQDFAARMLDSWGMRDGDDFQLRRWKYAREPQSG
jgi:hypothetical protein